jgi:AraC-like DNA-binding protein
MRTRYRLHEFSKTDFPVRVEIQDSMPWPNVGAHEHDFMEIVIFLRGSTCHVSPAGRETVSAGDVLVIRPDEWHGYEGFLGLRLVNLHFKPEVLYRDSWDLASDAVFQTFFRLAPQTPRETNEPTRRIRLSAHGLMEAERLCLLLHDEQNSKRPGRAALAHALFFKLIVLIIREAQPEESHAPERLRRLAEAYAYLEANYREPLNLKDLAKRASMSVNQFLRVFREIHGSAPMTYIIGRRLANAHKLLLETKLSITEIAFQIGFSDSNYFARAYRKAYGSSPTEVRNGHRTNGYG